MSPMTGMPPVNRRPIPGPVPGMECIYCGCSDEYPCPVPYAPGFCWWAEEGVCSRCARKRPYERPQVRPPVTPRRWGRQVA